jgi:enoyl-CoA hydratase/carnithine racemase
MASHNGKAASWKLADGVFELELHREPCNEIGTALLEDLERFLEVTRADGHDADAIIIHSTMKSGFCAGADLRELYSGMKGITVEERVAGVRSFLVRIHAVMNALDASPLVTIAAVHGVTFGGGLELALACDLIVADKMARFCFPELRLGLIPGFGGVPRLKRDLGNAVVRDILLTGRSINASKALGVGLVSQVVAEGKALAVARLTAAQIRKFDRATRIAAKQFAKPIPYAELRQEIEVFCQLLARPAVEEGLRKFVESSDALPYLP